MKKAVGARVRKGWIVGAVVGVLPVGVWGQVDWYYVGNGASWNSESSWSVTPGGEPLGAVPQNGDTAWLNGSTGVSVPFDATYDTPGMAAVYVDGSRGATMTLWQSDSTTSLYATNIYVGSSGSGVVNQAAGDDTADNDLLIGSGGGSKGIYSLSGSGSLTAGNNEVVGDSGTGTFVQSGALHLIGLDLTLGHANSGVGTYLLNGADADLEVGLDEFIGDAGVGAFTHSAGTHEVGDNLYVGNSAGVSAAQGTGTYLLSGTGKLMVDLDEYLGYHGSGTLTQTGGSHRVSDSLYMSSGSAAAARYDMSGDSLLEVDFDEYVGNNGPAQFNQSGGTHTIANDLHIGSTVGASGKYTLSGTGAYLEVDGNETIGESGTGQFVQTGGTHVVYGTLTLAASSGSSGTLTLSGGTLSVPEIVNRGKMNYNAGALETQTLTIAGGGVTTLAAGGDKVLRLDSLSMDTGSGSKLDLNDNDLVVNKGDFSTIQNLVFNGYRQGADSSAAGIISTTGQTIVGNPILALVNNALIGASDYPFGSGQIIAANAVFGKYTYFGDTNLDGQVTSDDYGALDANYGATGVNPGIAWIVGDTNFDGSVTADDYGALDANFGLGVGNPLSAQGAGAVPEPASVGAVVGFGLLVIGSRRRTHLAVAKMTECS